MTTTRNDQETTSLAGSDEVGSLGVLHLKRFWSRMLSGRDGVLPGADRAPDWVADQTLLSGLRVDLHETLNYLFSKTPTFEEFETWILEKNGGTLDPGRIELLNAALSGREDLGTTLTQEPGREMAETPFSPEDLRFWDENGYVVLHDAVPPVNCKAAAQAIYDFLGMEPDLPETWYGGKQGHSIWIPLLHHPALWANRESPRIHQAFAQLWGRQDLWVSVDQCGMNPPEKPGWRFPGPRLHWDVSLEPPVPFGVQGILYLTDTGPEQGAFRCVPGFHRLIDSWLKGLPPDVNPWRVDLEALGAVSVAGRAGDLIIWHHALPHGSSPNRATRPRVVQYLKMLPSRWEYNPHWR